MSSSQRASPRFRRSRDGSLDGLSSRPRYDEMPSGRLKLHGILDRGDKVLALS